MNIPAMRPPTSSVIRKMWWAILDSRTKIKWMIFTILIPEYIVGKALNELLGAKLGETDPEMVSNWEEVHHYMANMGYFVLDLEDYWPESTSSGADRTVEEEGSVYDSSKFRARTMEPGFSLKKNMADVMQEGYLSTSTRLNLSRLTHQYWALNRYQLFTLGPNIIDLPDTDARQLQVLNRGDTLVKILALVQIIYLVIQLVVRKVTGLPSTQLEIGALAFSISSIATYILYWNRPQGVESTHIIKPKCAPSKARILELAGRGPSFMWTKPRAEYSFDKLYDVVPVPNDALHIINSPSGSVPDALEGFSGNNAEMMTLAAGAFLGGTVFGGVHCLAWNFHFPTPGEALAWRICSVLTSAIPLLSVLPLGLWARWHPWDRLPRKSSATRIALALTLIFGLLVPYILARIFLLVEIFRSLFFLPPEAFVDTWSGAFPHWG